jgi:hypothetical protein
VNVPGYPRIAHLLPGRGTRDDLVLGAGEVRRLFAEPVIVEEKLDGANVRVWWEDGWFRCSLRSGEGGLDRAGQLGPLRAWLGDRVDQLAHLLAGDRVLFAEWLLLEHSIHYSALPSYLVGLDVWEPVRGWVDVESRDGLLAVAEIPAPPEVFRGVVGGIERLEAMVGDSPTGGSMMEGVVVRRLGTGEPRLAKLVSDGFRQIDDSEWRAARPHNQLAFEEASWR